MIVDPKLPILIATKFVSSVTDCDVAPKSSARDATDDVLAAKSSKFHLIVFKIKILILPVDLLITISIKMIVLIAKTISDLGAAMMPDVN